MRYIYAGAPAFSVPPLQQMLAAGFYVCAVLTRPDRPVGRIVAITTVGRIPSVVSSTLAAGALGDGNYLVASIVAALAIVLAGAGVVLYRVMTKRAQEEATRTTDGTA